MDGSFSGGQAGRPIKRGRGGSGAAGPSASIRGRGGSAHSSFERKLAGTPLFKPPDDGDDAVTGTSEESGDDLPDSKQAFGAGANGRQTPSSSKLGRRSHTMNKEDALYDSDAEKARKSRFETVGTENRYLQMKPLREKERRDAIASGLIPDPLKPRKLDEAITFQASCMEMCPEFEREEREYQKNVDRWEMTPGTNRIDRYRAVKAFHRPAAGNDQPLPADVRPPKVLKRTLNYLFHDIVAQDPGLSESHPFLRDRTRAIRQDFTLQNDRGSLAIECHERIARYHILCLHVLREWENFNESQELEQLRKVLQSLNEFYEDARHEGRDCPHEAEFRAYYLITHLRDPDTIRQIELLPPHIFRNDHVQAALRLHALAQRNNESRGERGRRPANSEASLNAFSRFFKAIARDDTSYLLACLAETHFADVRRGALVCLRKAYMAQHPEYPLPKLARILGCDGILQCAEIAENFGLEVAYDTRLATPSPYAVLLHRGVTMTEYPPKIIRRTSRTIVGAKQGDATFQAVIDGEFYSSHVDLASVRKHIAKKTSISRRVDKSLSPRTSLKVSSPAAGLQVKETNISTPPISVPSSPSLANKKIPFAPTGRGLSATASVFAPSAFKPSLSPAPPVVNTIKAPSRPQLAERSPSSIPVPSQLIPTPPVTTSATNSQIKPAHTPLPGRSFGNPLPPTASTSRAPVSGPSIVDSLAMLLLERLLTESVRVPAHNAAADGLGQFRIEQREHALEERTELVEQCASNLSEVMLEQYSAEAARSVAFECECDRTRLRQSLKRWQECLAQVKSAKKAREIRRKSFKALNTELSNSPVKDHYGLESITPFSPNATILDLTPDPFVDSNDTSSMHLEESSANTSVRTANDLHKTKSFWSPETLSILICDLTNKTFSSFRTKEPPEWKIIVVIPTFTDSLASWYRCKLGMSSLEEQRTDSMPYVNVEFVLSTADDLAEESLSDVGLVIINIVGQEDYGETARILQERLASESRYRAHLLQTNWTASASKVLPSIEVHNAQTNEANAGLAEPLRQLLQDIHLNNSAGSKMSAPQLARSFLSMWELACQTTLVDLEDSKTIMNALRGLISILQVLPEHIDGLLLLDEDDSLFTPPAFQASSASLQEAVRTYAAALPSLNNISLGFLRLGVSEQGDAPSALALQLCEALSSMMHQSLTAMPVNWEAATSDIKQSLQWWQETVDERLRAIVEQIAASSAPSPEKKRRRPSGNVRDEQSENAAKKIRETPELVWKPKKLLDLNSLIADTRKLLGNAH